MKSNQAQINYSARLLINELINFQVEYEISDDDMLPVVRQCLAILESEVATTVPYDPIPVDPLLN